MSLRQLPSVDLHLILQLNSHNFNHELGAESMEVVRPGWEEEPIMKEWAKYARSQMGE